MKGRIKMKHTWKRLLSLFVSLCLLAGLMPAALAALPTATAYVQDTDGVDSGAVYAIYTNEDDADGSNRILYHTGTGKTDKVTASVSGDELALNGGFDASRQLWTITAVEGGYTVQSVDSHYYLDLSKTSTNNLVTSASPVTLTINFNTGTGLYTISHDETYLSFSPSGNTAFLTGNTGYGLRFFKQTEEPEPEPADPLVIPGYTQLTGMPAGGLDTSKYYLVVTKDNNDNLYALYINQAGTSVGPGALSGANGACTATLTVSGDTVTAAYLNGNTSVDVNDLRITVNTSGNGYTFRSGNYGLTLGSKMFSTDYTALSVSVDEDGLWTIKNTASGRLLSFNQNGNTAQSQYPNHITDFWGPNGGKSDSFPIYLYVQDNATVPVDKGALNAAIDEATALDKADYTTDSWSALQTALTAAQGVADNDSATQTQVNEACAALEAALDALVRQLTPPDSVPTATAYIQDTDGIDSGAVYAIYTNASTAENNRILYHTGTGETDKLTGSVSGNELALNGRFDASRQLWTITAVEGGYTVRSVNSSRYLDLSQASSANLATSDQPVVLTIDFDQETGLYTIYKQDGYALNFDNSDVGVFSTTSVENAYGLRLFQQTEVPAETVEVEDLIPASGTTQNEPFAPGTGGSNNFRIPSLITLDSGRIVAAIDARWNHLGDACALDTILSYSDDGGKTWNYSFPNYFGDSVDAFQSYATAFIDPVMVQGKDGTIYLLVDLFPGGVAINTAPMRPAQATGYVEINGVQRLVLYLSGNAGEQTDANYAAYVGDFVNGYAQVYDVTDGSPTGYYVDDHYYLYYSEETTQNPEQDKIYCQQLGSSKFVQQNVFFYNAQLHVRCATYLWLVTSTDGGETWSAPTILNPQIRTGKDQFYGVGPGAGLCLEDGTIIMPAYTFSNQIASFVYSTDGGKTWHRSENATGSGHWSSESCLVQIDETTVRHFYRDGYSTLYYTDHTWNGESWEAGSPVNTNVPNTSNNQLSAITYSQQLDGKDVILVSTATGAGGSRTNGKIYTFVVNEDKTMTLVNTYEVTASGESYSYSSLTELADGSISVLYEGAGSRSVYVNIPASKDLFGDDWSPVSSVTTTSYAITVDKADNGTVTSSRTRASKGLTVTLTVKPDEGYALDTLTVTDKKGSEIKLTDKGDGKYTFTMPASAVVVQATFTAESSSLPFTDVSVNDWFYDAVAYVYDNGLMDGTAGTAFSPLMTSNRAMVVTILWRLAGSPEPEAAPSFSDVTADSWYTDAVAWASENGIVKGYSDTVFAPDDTVTREQLATILYRYVQHTGGGFQGAWAFPLDYADADQVSDWAYEAMCWCTMKSIINGVGGNTLNPQGSATRAEVAQILMNFSAADLS